MCDPITAGIATVASAGLSLYGAQQQAKAAQQNQQAIVDANNAAQVAQNQAFTQRNAAAQQQTAAQLAASQETLNARAAAATQMRAAQMNAMQQYADTLKAENTQAETLRSTGDTAAQSLLQKTTADQMAQAEQERQQQTAALVNQNATPQGPQTSDPAGSSNAVQNDLATGGALARRTAEAATNIRNYGATIAKADAYGTAPQEIALAVGDTKYGIMPAQRADELLRGGSATRLLPSQANYQAATGLGNAADLLAQSRGQNALDAAGLSYGNAVDLANLRQSNADVTAKNTELQKQSDAQYLASQGQILQGLGKLGAYGAGYFGNFGSMFGGGAAPGWAAGTGAGSGTYTNLATGATTDISGVTMPGTFANTLSNLGSFGNKISNIF